MAMAATSEETEERKHLVEAIQSAQRIGVRTVDGACDWARWLWYTHGIRGDPDPQKHKTETLWAFVDALPAEGQLLVRQQISRAGRTRRALARFREVATMARVDGIQRLLELLEHTFAHRRFADHYLSLGCDGDGKDGWVVIDEPHAVMGLSGGLSAEDLVVAIDCEMVATAEDNNALARVCVCNGRGVVLLDRLVCPDARPTDLRTRITGIEHGMLDVDYTRADAQRDIIKLLTPFTVVVGHTLQVDLKALKLDVAPLLVDVAFLYSIEGSSARMPPLAHLVDQVLGVKDFRGVTGRAPHNCQDDTLMTMKLLLHQLGTELQLPHVVRPLPDRSRPLDVGGSSRPSDQLEMLYVHRVPQVPGAFGAVVQLFPPELLLRVDLQVPRGRSAAGGQGWQALRVICRSAEAAMRAYQSVPGIQEGKDRTDGRPQKLVELVGLSSQVGFRAGSRGNKVQVYVRGPAQTCAGGKEPAQQTVSTAPTAPTQAERSSSNLRRVLDDELYAAGGEMPWKRARNLLVEICRSEDNARNASEEELGWQILASIPESYLSKEDDFVRLPPEGEKTCVL